MFIFILTLVANIQAQTRYFQAYQVQFYDGNFNLIETSSCDKVIKVSDTDHTLIISGSLAFYFYGSVRTETAGVFSQMATPNDGSGNCRIFMAYTSSTSTRFTIRWTNMSVAYTCRN